MPELTIEANSEKTATKKLINRYAKRLIIVAGVTVGVIVVSNLISKKLDIEIEAPTPSE